MAVRTGARSELKTAGEAMALWLRPSIALRKAFTTRIYRNKKYIVINTAFTWQTLLMEGVRVPG